MMRLKARLYQKITHKEAPYYLNYSVGYLILKMLRKGICQNICPNLVSNRLRIALYRLCGFKIGKGCFIGMKCYLDDLCPEMLIIGDNVIISYGVYFACHGDNQKHNPIIIDNNSYVGMRAMLISNNADKGKQGIHLYPNSIVGAGTLVNQDVPANCIALGVPCRIKEKPSDYLDNSYKSMRLQ